MRLTHPTIRPFGRPITFQFDGSPIAALEGETIAAALSAAGIVAFRRTPSGAPRGLHCGMGACFDCVVTVDGRIGQRACMTKVADGMVVTGEAALPLAPLGREPVPRRPRNGLRRAGRRRRSGRAVRGDRGGRSWRAGRGAGRTQRHRRASTPSRWPTATPMRHRMRSSASALELRDRALAAGARIETEATVWGGFAADEIAALVRGRR